MLSYSCLDRLVLVQTSLTAVINFVIPEDFVLCLSTRLHPSLLFI